MDRNWGGMAPESSGPEGMEIAMRRCIHKVMRWLWNEIKELMGYGSFRSGWRYTMVGGRMDA